MIDRSYFAHKDVRVANMDDMFDFFVKEKKDECLRLVLGAALFNELNALLDVQGNLPDTAADKWKNLVNGTTYDDKVWRGFVDKSVKRSFIAYYVYSIHDIENESHTYGTGEHTSMVENSKTVNSERKRILARNKFVESAGGLYCNDMVSLYQYMNDHLDDFPTWNPTQLEYSNVWNV